MTMEMTASGAAHIPGRSPVEGLGGVVPALAVAAEEEELVVRGTVIVAARVQVLHPALESLPLRLLTIGVEALVGRVVPLQQAEVDLGLVFPNVSYHSDM